MKITGFLLVALIMILLVGCGGSDVGAGADAGSVSKESTDSGNAGQTSESETDDAIENYPKDYFTMKTLVAKLMPEGVQQESLSDLQSFSFRSTQSMDELKAHFEKKLAELGFVDEMPEDFQGIPEVWVAVGTVDGLSFGLMMGDPADGGGCLISIAFDTASGDVGAAQDPGAAQDTGGTTQDTDKPDPVYLSWPDNAYTKLMPNPGFKILTLDVSDRGMVIEFEDWNIEDAKSYVEVLQSDFGFKQGSSTQSDANGEYSFDSRDANGHELKFYVDAAGTGVFRFNN